MTGIPLITLDITTDYIKMMKAPKAGFGKNMNPCMDCHALMFAKAGEVLQKESFHFLFSGEVLGQRPKSQNKNSLRYVEKNSGFDGLILRPLCARRLPETQVEKMGLVDREQLLDITGRSRKVQMELAEEFNITDYPSPAGGCLLTDIGFSLRLKDLMQVQQTFEQRELYLLKNGRHFRLDTQTKVIVGRNRRDNARLLKHFSPSADLLIKHNRMAGPDVILTGIKSPEHIETAAGICASYTKAVPGSISEIAVSIAGEKNIIKVTTPRPGDFEHLMI